MLKFALKLALKLLLKLLLVLASARDLEHGHGEGGAAGALRHGGVLQVARLGVVLAALAERVAGELPEDDVVHR